MQAVRSYPMYSYLALAGAASAHVAPSPPTTRPRTALHAQTAEFAQPLWGRDNFDDVDESSDTVKCTVYNIGGELTQVLSLTCSKQLPMIPHVGVRLCGTEYFYSDVIESRPVRSCRTCSRTSPRCALIWDRRRSRRPARGVDRLGRRKAVAAESYSVFDHNHFARVICDKVTENGLEEWPAAGHRRDGGDGSRSCRSGAEPGRSRQITRLVVVSWGRATQVRRRRR